MSGSSGPVKGLETMPAKGSEKRASSACEPIAFREALPFFSKKSSSNVSLPRLCVSAAASCQARPTPLGILAKGARGGGGDAWDDAGTPSSRATRSKSSARDEERQLPRDEVEENQSLSITFEGFGNRWPAEELLRTLPRPRPRPSVALALLLPRLLVILLQWVLARLLLARLLPGWSWGSPPKPCIIGGNVEDETPIGLQVDLDSVLEYCGMSSSTWIKSQALLLSPNSRESSIFGKRNR
mmetsp:Transcript_59309/g.193447  ORF Transcript_59309/g.193447 Transcript_59309/m.193447 type:complete len:241 (+) Transcript_59309:761-1483(+)